MTEAVPPISDELKPCPFCGQLPSTMNFRTHEDETGETYGYAAVECHCLGSNGGLFFHFDTLPEAIAAWNRRASEAVKAEVVDRNAVIEECAALIEHGFPGVVGETYAADGVTRSKNDKCLHGQWMYEDCDQCCADAVRTLKSAAVHPQRTP